MSATPQRASNPAGKPRKKDTTVDLPTARKMLPLIQRIVADIVDTNNRLTRLIPEREALDDTRRGLDWSLRRRRYAVYDELATAEKNLSAAAAELDALGVALVDPTAGQVEFPTQVNGRPAAFTWTLGDDAVGYWRFAGEDKQRPIPADWQAPGTQARTRGR